MRTDIKFHDVFISWTGNDRLLKNRIKEYLENNGITCLESDEKCSGNFREWSRQAACACSVFLLIHTENSLKSQYMPVEVEEFKKQDDFCNRIVPVCTDLNLYAEDYFGISSYTSAVILDGTEAGENHLKEIYDKVKSLIVNRMDKIYKLHSLPDYVKLIPLCSTKRFTDKEFDYSNLYITRTISEINRGDGSLIKKHCSTKEISQSDDNIFIHGSGGAGKTKYIDQIRTECDDNSVVISLACHKIASGQNDIFSELYKEFLKFCSNSVFFTTEDFSTLMSHRHLILVFDGMDEISTSDGTRKFVNKIEEFLAFKNDNLTLIFTSRNESDADIIALKGRSTRFFVLENLSDNEVKTLSENLFLLFGNGDKSKEFYAQIKDLNEEIKTNPLLLSQLAIVYEDSGNIPNNIVGIYDAVSEITLKLDKTKDLSEVPPQYKDMVTHSMSSILKRFSMERYMLLSKRKEKTAVKIFSKILKDMSFADFAERAEFLVEYLGNRAIIIDGEFYHKMFLEYFTAINFYELCFDSYDEIENTQMLDELFLHYRDSYWNAVIKLFLIKADSLIDADTTIELYSHIISLGITEYTLLLDVCRDLIVHRKEAQLVIVSDILRKSALKEYSPYGSLFWYIPKYELYENLLVAADSIKNESYFANALALTRDVCFLFSGKNFASEITDEVDAPALFEKAKTSLLGVRYALCELFCTQKTDFVGGYDIYPRCFNIKEAKNYIEKNCGAAITAPLEYKDELGLYSHEEYPVLNNEYIGIVSCPYDVDEIEGTLSEKSCSKVSGLILSPTQNQTMEYISINKSGFRIFYAPENITDFKLHWNRNMSLSQEIYGINDGVMYHRGNLVLPEGTQRVPSSPMDITSLVARVYLPDSIKTISSLAFYCFVNLSEIRIPEGVITIEDNAFKGCEKLSHIILPDSIEMIHSSAFDNCTSLKSIRIPDKVTFVSSSCFENCTSLEEVILPEKLVKIETWAFCKCKSLKKINIPNMVKRIECDAFSGCSALEEVNLPYGLKKIESGMFSGCVSLKQITIPEGVEEINHAAFFNCSSLTEIRLPDSIKIIESRVFEECDSLKRISNLPDIFDRKELGIPDSTIIEWKKTESKKLLNPEEIIPEGATVIKEKAFEGQTLIDEFVIPDGITEIEPEAFKDCISLKRIHIPNSVTKIGEEVFSECNSLAEVTLPEGMKVVEAGLFHYCSKLENVHIPDGVEKIDSMCFCGCEALKEIRIPECVTFVGNCVFGNCKSLERVNLPKNITEINVALFAGCEALKEIIIPDGVTEIKEMAFAHCFGLTELYIPDSVRTIGSFAFMNCANLQKVHLPKNLSFISDTMFADCAMLEAISIPETVSSIGGDAFSGCSSLTGIVLPSGISDINSKTFYNCEKLENIVLPDTVKSIGYSVFEGCSSLKGLNIPDGVSIIEKNAFKNCSSLEEIKLPETVREIRQNAFSNCKALKEIVIPESVRLIEDCAFEGCSSLTDVTMSFKFEGDLNRIFKDCVPKNIIFK